MIIVEMYYTRLFLKGFVYITDVELLIFKYDLFIMQKVVFKYPLGLGIRQKCTYVPRKMVQFCGDGY